MQQIIYAVIIKTTGGVSVNKRKNVKENKNIAAVITIGSELVKMLIANLRGGEIRIIDVLTYPLNLGHEVFSDKKISFESLKELSKALEGFTRVMDEYGITQYKAVATSVFREASNREFVIDQLKIRNDINIEVLGLDKAKSLIFSEIIRSSGKNEKELSNTLISYLGTGSISLSVYKKGVMEYTRNFSTGSMKLTEIIDVGDLSLGEYYTALDEYIDSVLDKVVYENVNKSISNLILAGTMVKTIAKQCGVESTDGSSYRINLEDMERFHNEIRKMPLNDLCDRFNVSNVDAELLYTASALYIHLLKLTKANEITAVITQLSDALMAQLLLKSARNSYDEHVARNAASCARALAKHYGCASGHYEAVCKYALLIFDKLKKLHGLNARHRLLLELACILHESGSFINTHNKLLGTYDIIKNTEFYGLSSEDSLLVAAAASCEDVNISAEINSVYHSLSQKNRFVVIKLSAILSVANALDISQDGKFNSMTLKLKEDELIIYAETDKNAYLEKWAFKERKTLFEDVFGIKLRLVVKSPYFK